MKYIIKKIGTLILTLFIISFLSFLAFQIIPGDAALSRLGTDATPEQVEALREEMGLNAPMLVRYGNWLKDFVSGDFGTSYSYNMPVSEMLAGKLPITLVLTAISFLLILAISIPLGLFTGSREGSRLDRATMMANQVLMSIPGFFLGILITAVLGLGMKLFIPGAYVSYREDFGGFLYYLIFPAIAIALPKCAMGVKMLRSSVIGQLHMDYVRTAYSKGNSQHRVMYHHILKNAMIPVLTFWALTISDIVANSIIIEQVFTIPGLGSMLIQSISNRDYPVVQAIIVMVAGLVVVINFLVDLLYTKIDPRVTIE